eukprot:CAMPEP_0194507076 /NCGR_PEP_ID=MMETSP0253-20130528/36009_1 /TAXON_ID=2966 /ORGANISM="Noctiluca scintillans" /LENGTH=53 /DNA_ID=CAMNT_0039349907 /DNA_START=56 /DNA_END=214 /DNA_ORIENTATION=-
MTRAPSFAEPRLAGVSAISAPRLAGISAVSAPRLGVDFGLAGARQISGQRLAG